MFWTEENEWKEIVESSVGSYSNSRKRKGDDEISADSEKEASCSDEMRSIPKLKKHRPLEDSAEMRSIPKLKKVDSAEQQYAEPLIRCVWRGNANVWHGQSEFNDRYYRFNAFLSSKSCQGVRRMAGELKPGIQFQMFPRSYLWPKSFRRSGPTDDAIALFFFPPQPEDEKSYDSLVNEMICDDLAMTAYVEDRDLSIYNDLLIFTSVELPWQCRRYQGKFYLWGVFRRSKD
ncbi:hypothetical protein ACS0TY_010109 [Phlomoides rotata]